MWDGDRRERLKRWAGEEIALEETKTLAEEEVVFGNGFDAFRDDFNFEVVAGTANSAEDVLAWAGAVDTADESGVELDLIGREVVEQREAGVGSAEIVDGETDAEGTGLFHEGGEMGAVVDDSGFRHFEDDVVGGDAGALGGFESGEDRSGPRVETLRQKIEMQRDVDAEADSQSDGGGAGGLIEEVKAERRDLVEDLPGRLVPCAADKSFVGDHCFGYAVDDGLEGETEGGIRGMMQSGAEWRASPQELVGR
jgi:hypothetical protein